MGAKVLAGGKLPSDTCDGQYYPPTVLANITTDMLIAKEEIFGPILCIFHAWDEKDAIRIANDCEFALSGCVFSKNQQRAAGLGQQV
jgi:aldehyde dehydrogenase (NAD+)